MSGLEDIYLALRTVVIDRFSVQRGGNPGSAFVAFEFGTPVPYDTFRLNDPARTLSPELAVEFLSHQSNTAPDVSEMMFRRSERTVEDQYGLMLAGATASGASAELLGGVKRDAAARFDNTLGSLRGPYRFRPVMATPINWYDSSKTENWSHIKIDQQNRPPPPPPSAPHRRIDPRLLKWRIAPVFQKQTLEQPPSAKVFRDIAVAHVFDTAVLADDRPRHEMLLAHNVFLRQPEVAEAPLAPASPALRRTRESATRAVGRPPHSFDEFFRADESVLRAAPVAATPPQTAKFFSPLLDVRAALDLQAVFAVGAVEQPVAADGFFLEVDMCLVELQRPWLSDALLTLPGWYVPGFPRGSFSSATPENTGHLSIIPTACIFIRNLSIKSQWSEADQQVIETSAGLGTFNLFGRSFDRNTMTLAIPGMQSFAWICEPLPLLPPLDAPQA